MGQFSDNTLYLVLAVLVVASTIEPLSTPATVLVGLVFLAALYALSVQKGWVPHVG